MAGDALSAFDGSGGHPVAIVFGTWGFRDTVRRWIKWAEGGSCDHWRVVCMDRELAAWLQDTGRGAQAVHYYDAVPDVPPVDFEALPPQRRLSALVPLRVKLFRRLASSGRDFIHSDADAFWLHDPRPWLASHPDCDLLASQGTTWPTGQYLRHHFVLCAGFFLCRSNERTRAYFARVDGIKESGDDQLRMNAALVREPPQRWDIRSPEWWTVTDDGWHPPSRAWRAALAPLRLLAGPKLSRVQDRILLRLGLDFIVTSPEVIRGRFRDGMLVGVIPMRLVWRGVGSPDGALVRHPVRQRQSRGRRWGLSLRRAPK